MTNRFSASFRGILLSVAMVLMAVGPIALGCKDSCNDSCDSDSDCSGDLVCYASHCAPKECEENCMELGYNQCMFNQVSCDYISCNN